MKHILELAIKEYKQACKKAVEESIRYLTDVYNSKKQEINPDLENAFLQFVNTKFNTEEGYIIPYIKPSPKSRYYYHTPINIHCADEKILRYKPYMFNYTNMNVLFYEDTTVYDKPYNETHEVLLRFLNKINSNDINSALEYASSYFLVDLKKLKKFYKKLQRNKPNKIQTRKADFDELNKYFCNICVMFNCGIHIVNTNLCFSSKSSICYCQKKYEYSNIDNYGKIMRLYRMYNYDKCFTTYIAKKKLNIEINCDDLENKKPKTKKFLNLKNFIRKDNKFESCSHQGSCYKNGDCVCYKNKTGCHMNCLCTMCDILNVCTKCKGIKKECICLIKALNTVKELDYGNFKEKKTYVYESKISGFGCYAGENIKRREFVFEYTGEMISKEEGNRRANFYDVNKLSYLFEVPYGNKSMFIDAMRFGNNSRFINHSKNPNIEPRIIEVNKTKRILFFAKKNIRINEELLFNYQYNEEFEASFNLKG